MPNKYKWQFEKMLEENPGFISFVKTKIDTKRLDGEIVEVLPSKELVYHSNAIAKEKARKTMSFNQNLTYRSDEVKISNLCRGIIGEAAVQLLLIKTTGDKNVYRFDLERETFDYVPSEYDLKYKDKRIEVRTSNNKYKSLDKYIDSNDNGVILKYINNIKEKESDSDFYFAIVYDYPGQTGGINYQKRINFVSDILNRKLKIYIITGTNFSESKKYGEIKNLGQSNTRYSIVGFSNCRNIRQLLYEIRDI